jgi:alpha-1,2-mannosyltransferase
VGRSAKHVFEVAAFIVIPLLLLWAFLRAPQLGYDFRAVWDASRAIRHGDNPYPSVAAIPDHPKALQAFVYPPPIALLALPTAALPFSAVAFVLALVDVVAAVVAVRLLGVRDWRCYGVVVGCLPLLGSARLGALSPLLLLLVALAWRARSGRAGTAVAVAAAVVVKLFLWPLLIWLLATRRLLAAVLAGALCVAVTIAGWALIGFDGIGRYPALLGRVSHVQYEKSFSLLALLHAAGLPNGVARVALLAAAALFAGMIWVAGRSGNDDASFSLSIVAALFLTPLLWLHYFVLLLVPVALRSPRLSRWWLLPLAFYATPWEESGGRAWTILVALGLSIAAVWPTAQRRWWRAAPREPLPRPPSARAAPAP